MVEKLEKLAIEQKSTEEPLVDIHELKAISFKRDSKEIPYKVLYAEKPKGYDCTISTCHCATY